MIISRTPFRISFFGGGTDYPVWFREHGGSVLATSIDKYCYISLRYLPPFFGHKSRIVYSQIESVSEHGQIQHPAVREALRFAGVRDGLEIHHDGDLPARTGLGSSSSFTVGLLHALDALQQKMPSKMELARNAIIIERDRIGESVGSQDQVTASFGGFNRIQFRPDEGIVVQPVIMKTERLEALQEHMILLFTGFSRHASAIAEKQILSTPHKTAELSDMQGMVDEGLRLLCGTGDLTDFGRLLHASWKLKRSLGAQISTPAIDEIYEAAKSAGALGGKLLGSGGGGFMMLFAPPHAHERIREKLGRLLNVPFRFDSDGSRVIYCQQDS